MECKSCGRLLDPGMIKCPKCRTLVDLVKICSECKQKGQPGDVICGFCDIDLVDQAKETMSPACFTHYHSPVQSGLYMIDSQETVEPEHLKRLIQIREAITTAMQSEDYASVDGCLTEYLELYLQDVLTEGQLTDVRQLLEEQRELAHKRLFREQVSRLQQEAEISIFKKDWSQAINILEEYLSLDGSSKWAQDKLSKCRLEQQKQRASEEQERKAFESKSNELKRQIENFADSRKWDEARQLLDEYGKLNAGDESWIQEKHSKINTGISKLFLVDMVLVEGGKYRMGKNDGDKWEKPVHSVAVSSFYIGRYPVTQRDWIAVLRSNPSNWKGDYLPVEKVSWYDAIEFCNELSIREGLTPVYTINKNLQDHNSTNNSDRLRWVVTVNWSSNGYRLPTEAEWEYAAQGGNKSRGFMYSGSNNIGDVAWYRDNSDSKTHPVGSKKPNELGIYDMSGNVWEWCWDWFDDDYYSVSSDNNPQGASRGYFRTSRGGSWYCHPSSCESSNRGFFRNYCGESYGGFRVCRRFP